MSEERLSPLIPMPAPRIEAIMAQWLGRPVHCHSSTPLSGGACATVLEVLADGLSEPVVVKIDHTGGNEGGRFALEASVLRHFREHTLFPVPEPLGHGTCGDLDYLVMERIPGEHLEAARLSATERRQVQCRLGEAVAELHTHTAPRYGGLMVVEVWDTWEGFMREELADLLAEAEVVRLLSPEAVRRAHRVVDALPRLLDAPAPPTLTHGDLWSTNIMVDRGMLSGVVDPGGQLLHPEYELAYLELFHTADEAFFEAYHSVHPRLEGYQRRRQVYWLSRLLLHVWLFQTESYVSSTERLLERIEL